MTSLSVGTRNHPLDLLSDYSSATGIHTLCLSLSLSLCRSTVHALNYYGFLENARRSVTPEFPMQSIRQARSRNSEPSSLASCVSQRPDRNNNSDRRTGRLLPLDDLDRRTTSSSEIQIHRRFVSRIVLIDVSQFAIVRRHRNNDLMSPMLFR